MRIVAEVKDGYRVACNCGCRLEVDGTGEGAEAVCPCCGHHRELDRLVEEWWAPKAPHVPFRSFLTGRRQGSLQHQSSASTSSGGRQRAALVRTVSSRA